MYYGTTDEAKEITKTIIRIAKITTIAIILFLITLLLSYKASAVANETTVYQAWSFEECAASDAANTISGAGRANMSVVGTIRNATGINGCGRNNTGQNTNYLQNKTQANITLSYPWSVSFWFKNFGTTNDGNPEALMRGDYSDGSNWYIHRFQNTICFGFASVNSCSTTATTSSGEWINIIGVMEAANRFLLYYNGSLQKNATDGGSLGGNMNRLRFLADGNARGFNGIIDEIYFFQGAPTTADVARLSNRSNPNAFYPFYSIGQTNTTTGAEGTRPLNQTFYENTLPIFYAKCNFTGGGANGSLYINNTYSGSNITLSSNAEFSIVPLTNPSFFTKQDWIIGCTGLGSVLQINSSTKTFYYTNSSGCSGTGGSGTCTPPSGITISPSCSIYQSGSGAFWNIKLN